MNSEYVDVLKEMVEKYPFFVMPRILLTYAYIQANDVNSKAYINESTVYCSDRQWLYNYVYPEKITLEQPIRHERNSKISGNYFDMINTIESEGGDSKQSLKEMARKLKEARAIVIKTEVIKTPNHESLPISVNDVIIHEDNPILKVSVDTNEEISEINAKKFISERKYVEAIEILKALYLNNPKKSIYFADQIRFLEKVIINSKK
ncbi:MAG: hypothetical protein WCK78_05435 [Paludibacter sp.]